MPEGSTEYSPRPIQSEAERQPVAPVHEQAQRLTELASTGLDGLISKEAFPDIPDSDLSEHLAGAQFTHARRLDSMAGLTRNPVVRAQLKKKAHALHEEAEANLACSVTGIDVSDGDVATELEEMKRLHDQEKSQNDPADGTGHYL